MKSVSFELNDGLFIHINLHRQTPRLLCIWLRTTLAHASVDEVTT